MHTTAITDAEETTDDDDDDIDAIIDDNPAVIHTMTTFDFANGDDGADGVSAVKFTKHKHHRQADTSTAFNASSYSLQWHSIDSSAIHDCSNTKFAWT